MKRILLFAIPAVLLSTLMPAQCSLGCGTGVDGAYTASSNTTLAGGTYNFTSFTIDPGVTVAVTGTQPLIIYCNGNVLIEGTLHLSGTNGADGVTYSNAGAGGSGTAGGQDGGAGSFSSSLGPINGTSGNGAGMGGAGMDWSGGGGAGYATAGDSSGSPTGGFGGPSYGNPQINPAAAGSGGAGGSGGYDCGAGGGGGGGGYLSITSCGTITISATGAILSNGGNGGSDGLGNCGGGGGGSGGSILLLTNSSITNNGLVAANGGIGGSSQVSGNPYYGTGANGSAGRIFYSYQNLSGSGSTSPVPFIASTIVSAAVSMPTLCAGSCDGSLVGTVSGGTAPYTYNWMPGNFSSSSVSNVCAGTYTLTGTDANGCTAISTVTVTSPQAVVVALTATNPACVCDGAISSNVSGGTAPYTFSWSSGETTSNVSGLCAGCYTVTVTDANGCVETQSVCITAPSPLATTVVQMNNVSCNGDCNGTATILASGGTGSYTYSWLPSACNLQSCASLCAASYSVTVTDSLGCTSTQTFAITEPPVLQAVTTSNSVSCFGDCSATAIVSVMGGTPGYSVLWSPGNETQNTITGLCAGTYTVTATDTNGCAATSTTTVTSPPQLTAVTTSNSVPCFGDCNGSAAVAVSGGAPGYTYSWAPTSDTTSSIGDLCAGTFTVTSTDANGCTITSTTTVTSPTQLVATATHTDETSAAANDGTATAAANGGTPGYTYLWMPGNQATVTATNLDAGTYTCTITDANGCTTTTTVTVGTAIGIDAANNLSFTVNLFPNPAQDQIQIAITLSQKANVQVELYNLIGEKIDVIDFGDADVVNHSYATSHLANGIYYFRVTSGTAMTTKKITVAH